MGGGRSGDDFTSLGLNECNDSSYSGHPCFNTEAPPIEEVLPAPHQSAFVEYTLFNIIYIMRILNKV